MKINEIAIRPLVLKVNNTLVTFVLQYQNVFELDASARLPYKYFETRANHDFNFEYRPKCLDSVLNIVHAIYVTKVTHYWNKNIYLNICCNIK